MFSTGSPPGVASLLLLSLHFANFGKAQNIYCTVNSQTGVSSSNRGASYAYYDTVPWANTATAAGTPQSQRFPAYDPTFVNVLQPIYIGQTEFIGFPTYSAFNTPTKIYPDSPTHLITNSTLVHRGYLYARTTGTYTFRPSYVDDIVITWLGNTAYSGYTRANAYNEFAYTSGTETPVSFTIDLTAGQYLPFRIQYTNNQEVGGLQYSITNPAGTVLFDRTTSVDIVSQPCDNSANFPDFYFENPVCTDTDPNLSTDGVGNKGFLYGVWNSTTRDTDAGNQQTGFSTYPVGAFDNVAAVHLGVTNRVGFSVAAGPGDSGQVVSIYGDTNLKFNTAFITIIHRSYLFARNSGSYSFSVPYNDDIVLVWIGNNALGGYTRANANAVSATTNNPVTRTFTVYLNAGQYLPIRIQWDNGQGGATLAMTVTDPLGVQLLSSTGSTDFYYRNCTGQLSNGNEVPQFRPPWFANTTTYTTVTTTDYGTATGTVTSTIAQPSGTSPGTVEVIVPASYVTITGPYTGTDAQPGTFTSTIAQPSGGNPGTVEVFTPAVYVTVTTIYTGMGVSISTIAQPSGNDPGTVEVFIPARFTTITTIYSGSGVSTATIAQPSNTDPGTVEVFIPASYATVTAQYSGPGSITAPYTTTLADPSGTAPGTVAIITPSRPATIGTTLGPNTCVCRPAPTF